jgi:CheY-like chemotaxis protein
MPALALTAFARPDDRKLAILAGYQAHLAKPFDVVELAIVVAGWSGGRSRSSRTVNPPKSKIGQLTFWEEGREEA